MSALLFVRGRPSLTIGSKGNHGTVYGEPWEAYGDPGKINRIPHTTATNVNKRSEYWKSLPRKFCEACKCWFADNKASIEFHERGKRHKENVEKRLADFRKKGKKDYDDSTRYEKAMAKIEQAALAAYRKDVESNPALAPKPKVSLEDPSEDSSADAKVKDWWEGKNEDGNLYYWSAKTGVSQWNPPDEPFVTIEEQMGNHTEDTTTDNEEEKELPQQGPQMKVDPYGQWTTVSSEPEPYVDLQLPCPAYDSEEIKAEEKRLAEAIAEEIPKNRFKEKTVESLGKTISAEGDGTFKKRKGLCDAKRNVRRRRDDDDE